MENLPLIDIVVGLSLIYTCASLLSSELTKFVIDLSRWRSKYLTQCLLTLLGESSNHHLILSRSITGKLLNSSYLTAMTQTAAQRDRSLLLAKITLHTWAEALLEVLQQLPQPLSSHLPGSSPIARIESIVAAAPELSPSLRTNLTRLICRVQLLEADPNQQIERLKSEIGIWFSYAIADATNAYKHHFKLISFLISLSLTLTLNIDSLYLIRRISENTATRAVIMQNATHIQGCQTSLSSLQCTENLSFLIESTTIPIGWQPANRQKQFAQFNRVVCLRTIGGWFLSSIAIAMGSRFWLHLFNRLTAILGRSKLRSAPEPVLSDRDPDLGLSLLNVRFDKH